MMRNVLTSIALAGLVALVPSGGSALFPPLPPLPPLPSLEIHIATSSPPQMRRESKPPRPGGSFLWINGSWDWTNGNWAWIGGRWELPDRVGARWVATRYFREEGAWRCVPGHWSHQRLVDGDDDRRWKADHGRRHGDQQRKKLPQEHKQ